MRINTKSIIFKTALIYVTVTLLNITVFNVLVWENQTGLIMDNAVLNSLHKGSSLKYRIDNIIQNSAALDKVTINKILTECKSLSISSITIFSENGAVFTAIRNGVVVADKKEASLDELKMINTALTKNSFEDKLFYHRINKDSRTIELYVPFTYEQEHNGIAALYLEMKNINEQMKYLYRQCIVISALIIIIYTFFALVMMKLFITPIRVFIHATRSISQGNLAIRVPLVRDDEIGQLASSFNEMSIAFTRMRDEAKGANPLTGLPGNLTIARYIDECLACGNCICVLYCDLDNFKAYNDKYSFSKGDEAILYTRDCLITIAKRNDMHNVFIGHEGGDDFVVVTPFEYWETFAKLFITLFDRGVNQFYNSIDSRNGYIESINRQGVRQRFNLMSISVAVVSNKHRTYRRHAEIIQVATEVKKYVKSIDGSCYAIDRRFDQNQAPTQTPAIPRDVHYTANG